MRGSRTEQVNTKTETRIETGFALLLISGAISIGLFSFFFFQQSFNKELAQAHFRSIATQSERAGQTWPHVRLAAHFSHRPLNDTTEAYFLATHFDYYVGRVGTYAQYLRQVNPNIQLAFMRSVRAMYNVTELQSWLAEHPEYEEEEFFLHYTQDTQIGSGENALMVKGWREECSPSCEPAATATHRLESRVPDAGEWRNGWFVPNPNYPGVIAFQADMLALRQQWHGIDGVFWDWCAGAAVQNVNDLSRTAEYAGLLDSDNFQHPFISDSISVMDQVHDRYDQFYRDEYGAISWVPCNTVSGYWTYDHPEHENNDYRDALLDSEANNEFFWEVWMAYNDSFPLTTGPSKNVHLKYLKDTVLLSAHKDAGLEMLALGNQANDRTTTFLLGLAYLVQSPDRAVLSYRLDDPAHHSDEHIQGWAWLPMFAFDIGQPALNPAGIRDIFGNANTSEFYEWASGSDPGNNGRTYSVYAREYDNALVLVKMRQDRSDGWGDTTITTHDLGRSYRLLKPDGTSGDLVSQVSLRNNEAVILIRTEAPLIESVDTSRVWSTQAQITARVEGASSVEVEYGRTTQYGLRQTLKGLRTNGEYTGILTGLTQGTEYHYRIKATGANGAVVYSQDYRFRTLQNSLSLLDIVTKTSEDGSIEFSLSSPNAELVQLQYRSTKTPNVTVQLNESGDGIFNTTLLGLLPGETYHYVVTSQQGNRTVRKSGTFTPTLVDAKIYPAESTNIVEE